MHEESDKRIESINFLMELDNNDYGSQRIPTNPY